MEAFRRMLTEFVLLFLGCVSVVATFTCFAIDLRFAAAVFLVASFLLLRPLVTKTSRQPSEWHVLRDVIPLVLAPHARTLCARKRVMLMRDVYGVEDRSKWDAEIEHVLENVLLPGLGERFTDRELQRRIQVGFRAAVPFLERWASRGVANREYEWFCRYARTLIDATADQELEESSESAVDVAEMEPQEFEHHCAEVLRTAGWTVTVLGGSGDQGVDLLAERDALRVALQCKLYSSPVGNSAVQEVFAGSRVHGTDRAYVVTAAGYTPSACAAAKATGVGLLDVAELADFDPTRSS